MTSTTTHNDFEVTAFLCDYAQSADGKINAIGGFWYICNPKIAMNLGLAINIGVPWNQTNRKHKLHVRLLDSDGAPFEMEGNRIELQAEFEAGRPPGLIEGVIIGNPLALNIGPLVFEPSKVYEWNFEINGDAYHSIRFMTREAPPTRK